MSPTTVEPLLSQYLSAASRCMIVVTQYQTAMLERLVGTLLGHKPTTDPDELSCWEAEVDEAIKAANKARGRYEAARDFGVFDPVQADMLWKLRQH